MVRRRPVHGDQPAGAGEHPAIEIEQAGARAAGADIDRHDHAIIHVCPSRAIVWSRRTHAGISSRRQR
jgi:hypothetical protein